MKVVLYANSDWYLYNFRRTLIQCLVKRGDDVLLLSPEGPYGKRLIALGARWLPLKMERRSLNPIKELGLLLSLAALLRREQPDLVHGFTIKGAVYSGLAGRLVGVRGRILAVAGLGYVFSSDSAKARALRPLVRAVMRLAFSGKSSRIIVQNREDFRFFEELGLVKLGRIRLIPGSGVDCQRFNPRVRAERKVGGEFRVCLPARLLRDKGVIEFANAARVLRRSRPDMRFVLAGATDPGNPDSVSEQEVAAWTAEGIIEYSGHVDDMPGLLATIDAVVLPTRYGEGVPRSLVEASACGIPVVASDIAGCRELITHEQDGLIVPVGDKTALVRAIERLCDEPHLARRLGVAARARVLELFSDEVVLTNTLAVYDEFTLATGTVNRC